MWTTLTRHQCTFNVTLRRFPHNHCYRGKAPIITYSECVLIAFGIQHVKRMRRVILSSVACSVVPYFFISPSFGDYLPALISLPNSLVFVLIINYILAKLPESKVSIPGGGKRFSLLKNVQTGFGTQPASCWVGTGHSVCCLKAAGSWSSM